MPASKNRKAPKTKKPAPPSAGGAEAPQAGKRARHPKDKGKLSAIAAAARVLEESGQAMSCPEMIEAMAAKGYWKSPGGKTPEATLYSGLAREIKVRGKESRFQKAGPGKFSRA